MPHVLEICLGQQMAAEPRAHTTGDLGSPIGAILCVLYGLISSINTHGYHLSPLPQIYDVDSRGRHSLEGLASLP